MSEQELNTYRFTSKQEPTDEMLAQIMQEAAHDAKLRAQRATSTFFSAMRREAAIAKATWADRINNVLNG